MVQAYRLLTNAVKVNNQNNTVIFGNYVKDPSSYGIAEFDNENNVVSIEEKPVNPKSNFAIVGLYFYPNSVVEIAKRVKPRKRGELEITSVNQDFKTKKLKLKILGRGFAWLDTGTHKALSGATEFVKVVENRTGLKIAALEEIALNYNWISKENLYGYIKNLKGDYYEYLKEVIRIN